MTTYARAFGSGTGGLYAANDRYTLDDANQMKVAIDKLSLGLLTQNGQKSGTRLVGRRINADGDYDLLDWFPHRFDNTSTHFSGFTDGNGATFVQQMEFLVRVSNAAISATPKIRYASTVGGILVEGTGTVLTIAGALACSAVAEDFTGTNSFQTVTFTLPSGVNRFKTQVTIAGTGGNWYEFWALAWPGFYVQNTI